VAAILIFAVIWITKNNGDTDEIVDNKQNELLAEDGELFDYQNAGSVQIGDYKGIEVVIEPDDEDVDLELSSVLDDMKPIKTDTVIKKGDYAYIDFTGSLDGIELDDLQGEDVILVVGNYAYVQPFEDALLGKKVGQTYSVTIQFDEDYQDKTVAGREVVFQVTVKAKFDDKYAKKVSKGKYSDVASYRESLAKRLRKENKENLVELAWDELVENCEVSLYPKKLVKEEKKNLKMQYEAFAEVSGVSYDELMESLMMDDDSVTETAQDTVRDRMIAKSIAEWEKFSVTDDVCRKYLIQLMEYEEDDDETLEQLIEDYEEDYGSRPKDDVLVAMAKEFVAKNASVK
jgi:trigger factor